MRSPSDRPALRTGGDVAKIARLRPAIPPPPPSPSPSRVTPTRVAAGPLPAIRPRPGQLFLVSFLSLFLELCLIRWVSAEVRIFAYCKNLVMLAAFLGLGLGCFRKDRPRSIVAALALLTALVALIQIRSPWLDDFGPRGVTKALSLFGDFQVFDYGMVRGHWELVAWLALGMAWTLVVFFGIAAVLVPYGQRIGALIELHAKPLDGYSINVAGALLGIAAYTALCFFELGPAVWFTAVFLLSFPLERDPRGRWGTVALAAVVALLFVVQHEDLEVIWSRYQKLAVARESGWVGVNNTGYQKVQPVPDFRQAHPPVTRWTMPYLARGHSLADVMIVGAGVGNDVAMALAAGAERVTAVEIDPAIYRLGTEIHPARPYASERVRVVIDDARHFAQTTTDRYDLIVFSHLDAHTLLSGYTNVRLDNYIYTVESLVRARELLKPDGLVFLSFWVEKEWISERLFANLSLAFGHRPLMVQELLGPQESYQLIHCFAARGPVGLEIFDRSNPDWARFAAVTPAANPTPPSTDDWPFLYVAGKRVPTLVGIVSVLILIVSFALLRRSALAGTLRIDGHFFLLGAAFMLIECHNLSRLALLFGTTWTVNTWVIWTILLMVLLANALVSRGHPRGYAAPYAGLAISLVAAWALPLGALEAWSRPAMLVVALVVLCMPILFAGLVFARSFANATNAAAVFGSNMLGSIVGGLLESAAFVTGLRSLVLISLGLYVLSYVALTRGWGRGPGTAAGA